MFLLAARPVLHTNLNLCTKFIKGSKRMDKAKKIVFVLAVWWLFMSGAHGQEKKLEPLNVAYSSVTPTHAPLWIAKEMGIFERYGLDVKTTNISAGAAIAVSQGQPTKAEGLSHGV